jgi:2-polyprenyl-3-methyl-5-hydroxy-6-metoxy-1,4-benzoquinol methylase
VIEFTGERIIPDQLKPTNMLLLEHIARYQFSIRHIGGSVLDLACGAGFGSLILAKTRKKRFEKIVAVDNDAATIAYARGRYHHPLIEYKCENAVDLSLLEKIGTFDSIVSFETLEHIEEEQQFLNNLYQLLKPGGTLIISTPFGKGRGVECGSPFHVHQLTVNEFHALFPQYMEAKFYVQDGVLIEPHNEEFSYPIGIAVCKK